MKNCQCIKISGNKCNSIIGLNSFIFLPPNSQDPIILQICQMDSDWLLNTLLLFDRAKLDEIRQKQEERRKIIKAYSNDAIIGLKESDNIQKLKEELKQIRFDNCRACNHDLKCLKNDSCKNASLDKYLLVVKSKNNTFRHAFHLHVKCALSLMSRCGYNSILEIKPNQTTLTI